jgi:hypothetical protein
MREKLNAETSLKREGFANEKSIADARNKTELGVQGLMNAGNLGVESKRVEGVKYGADLGARTRNRTSNMQFGLKSPAMTSATKPQYHYAENKDLLGNTVGHTAYRDGQPMPGPQPGELDWTKTINEDQFPQAGEVVKRTLQDKTPEEQSAFIDDVFKFNPGLGQYLMENQQAGQGSSAAKSPLRENTVGNTVGKHLSNMVLGPADQFMQNLTAPYRWGKKALNTEMPGWLKQ